MIVNEKTAIEKVCPIIQSGAGYVKCQASQCMAWRRLNLSYGYCGLAGKPEYVNAELESEKTSGGKNG